MYDDYEYLERQVDVQRPGYRPQERSWEAAELPHHPQQHPHAQHHYQHGGPPPHRQARHSKDSDEENNRARVCGHRREQLRPCEREQQHYREPQYQPPPIRDQRRRSRSPPRPPQWASGHPERDRPERPPGPMRQLGGPPAPRPAPRARSPPGRRSPTPPGEKLAKEMACEKERELRELERATRTIFAYGLGHTVNERDLFELFSKVGRVVDIRLITDKATKKSRGLAYVEFSRTEEVITAVSVSGTPLKGQPVMIKASEAEKNLAWEAAQQQKQSAQVATQQLLHSINGTAAAASAATPCWLTVSNLDRSLGDAEVTQLFAPFGGLELARVVHDASGRSTGVAHLHFARTEAGSAAMAHWHGRRFMDATLAVVAAGLSGGGPATGGAVVAHNAAAAGAGGSCGGPVVTTGELDEDEEGGGIRLSAQTRAALMARLAGGAGRAPSALVTAAGLPAASAAAGGLAVAAKVAAAQGLLGPASPIATPCVLLKNMFDAAALGPGGDTVAEVEADVRDECSRFGVLVHVWVDPKSQGFVYVRFMTTGAAEAAHRTLHGRWYGGRQILAEYQFAQTYNTHFKLQHHK